MAVSTFSAVLLFSLLATYSALPNIIDREDREDRLSHKSMRDSAEHESTVHEQHTPSTELQPPPLHEKEQNVTIYLINLYAIKNATSNVSEEMFDNEIIESAPAVLDLLVTVLLVVEEEEEEKKGEKPVDLDEFAAELEGQGFKVDRIDRHGKTKLLKVKMEKEEAESMIESSLQPDDEKKARSKRTVCYKCGGRRGWGGGGRGHGHGGGRYPGGGGCSRCGGGGGGGGGSWASSSSHAASGSWGGK